MIVKVKVIYRCCVTCKLMLQASTLLGLVIHWKITSIWTECVLNRNQLCEKCFSVVWNLSSKWLLFFRIYQSLFQLILLYRRRLWVMHCAYWSSCRASSRCLTLSFLLTYHSVSSFLHNSFDLCICTYRFFFIFVFVCSAVFIWLSVSFCWWFGEEFHIFTRWCLLGFWNWLIYCTFGAAIGKLFLTLEGTGVHFRIIVFMNHVCNM